MSLMNIFLIAVILTIVMLLFDDYIGGDDL